MLTETQVKNIKFKMIREKKNQTSIAKLFGVSNETISRLLNRKADYPILEKKIISWYKNKAQE